jgi:hypothetical protein
VNWKGSRRMLSQHLPGKIEENQIKPVRIAGVPAEV